MNLTLIANGLRMIADGLEQAAVAPIAVATKAKTTKDSPTQEPASAALPMYGAAAIAITDKPVAYPHTQSKPVTREDVIGAFTQLFQAKGQDAVIGILKANGLKRVSEATDAQLADLYAAAVGAANV